MVRGPQIGDSGLIALVMAVLRWLAAPNLRHQRTLQIAVRSASCQEMIQDPSPALASASAWGTIVVMSSAGQWQHSQRGRWPITPAAAALVLIAVLVLVLMWQSLTLLRGLRSTEQAVLHSYAELAADEWIRRSAAQIGYRAYYQTLLALQQQAADPDAELCSVTQRWAQADDALQSAAQMIEQIALISAGQDRCNTAPAELISRVDALISQARASAAPTDPINAFHQFDADSPNPGSWILAPVAGERWLGFKVHLPALGERFAELHQGPSMLPPSVADIEDEQARLQITVSDPSGRPLYAGSADYSELRVQHSAVHDDEYGGILSGYSVRVGIPPALAERLLASAPPALHPGWSLGLGATAILLGLIAWRQLRRERELVAMRSDFIARVSHELRTPLTQISLYADTLVLDRARSAADRSHALRVIQREARRLSHLIGNILRFSTTGPGRSSIAAVCVPTAVKEAVAAARLLAPDRQIRLGDCVDCRAAVDADALHQALLNLLDNALKYSPADTSVKVTVVDAAGWTSVYVDDAGSGIPTDQRERVIEAYYRLPRDRDSATPGTGIGLSVVLDIARRYGGRLSFEQSPAGGTRAKLAFPTVVQR